MDDSKGQVVGDAAVTYERFFVPALFAEWAPRVADQAALGPGQRALDVACGTGVLARELAGRIGATSVVGLDRNEAMLSVARSIEPDVTWQLGRAEALPWPEGQFDAVFSQFGLMFFENRPKGLSEMWRVLGDGGVLAVAVWGSLEETPGYAAVVELLARLFDETIANELRAPFCLGDKTDLVALFDAAAIPGVQVHTVVGTARFPSIDAWVRTDIRGWTLADIIDDAGLARILSEAPTSLGHFARDGGVCFDSPAHIAVARKGA
jgi:SAM-dependent methyltransferase